MGTYYDGWFTDLGWALSGDKSRIVATLTDNIEKNRDKWNKVYDTVMPAYQKMVTEGTIPSYSYPNKNIEETLAQTTGYPASDIQNFLKIVQSLAAQGSISMTQWKPAGAPSPALPDVPERVAVKTGKFLDRTVTYVGTKAGIVLEKTASETSKLLWPVAIGALAVAFIMFGTKGQKFLSKRS